MAPNRSTTAATPISTALTDAADCCFSFSIPVAPLDALTRLLCDLLGEEPGLFHEHDVPRLLASHPGLVVLPVQSGLVERALLKETLPIGGFPHFLENVDVVLHLLLSDAAGHENPAQHQVLDVQTRFLARGNVVPGHRLGDLRLVRHALGVEYAQRPQGSRPPLRYRLDRVVDGRIDVLADELHGDFAAAAVGDIREFRAGLPLDGDRYDLILLLGAGASH